MSSLAYERWHGADADRWREVLLLLAGRLRMQGSKAIKRDALPWLQKLLSQRIADQLKTPEQMRRDGMLAALSYQELGGRAGFAGLLDDAEAQLQQLLRQAMLAVLSQPDSAIATKDRIACAQVLEQLGDPRFPVTVEEWQQELGRRNQDFGKPAGYFCYMPEGSYRCV